MKSPDQNQLRKESGVPLDWQSQVIVHHWEVKAGSLASSPISVTVKSQEREYTHICLLVYSLPAFSSIKLFRTLCLGNGATHNRLCPPISISNQDNLRHRHKLDWSRWFLIKNLFLGDNRLCQVEIKTNQPKTLQQVPFRNILTGAVIVFCFLLFAFWPLHFSSFSKPDHSLSFKHRFQSIGKSYTIPDVPPPLIRTCITSRLVLIISVLHYCSSHYIVCQTLS